MSYVCGNDFTPMQLFPEGLGERIWRRKLHEMSPFSALLVKQLRIIIIVFKNFTRDKLQLQAAALTYYTLLSVVPVLAVIFAVAKGFGFQSTLENEIMTLLQGHEEIATQIMTFANRTLENASGGVIAGIGIIVLFYSVFRLLVSIEESFNNIWQVAKGRSFIRQFTGYFSIVLLAPILMLVSSSLTVIISFIESFVESNHWLSALGPAIIFLLNLAPYTLIWLLFTFLYMVVPNTKVKFSSALIAGIIAGTAFQLLEWGYIHFQVGVSKYNAIYGSFAALPLFLIWVNISWLITLIGAEIAYANQYVKEIEKEVSIEDLSVSQTHILAMMVCKNIIDKFHSDSPPFDAETLSEKLSLPFGITAHILEKLEQANLILEAERPDGQTAYVPAHDLDDLTVIALVRAINDIGGVEIPGIAIGNKMTYFESYKELMVAAANLEQNARVKDLPSIS
ncbi:MAG: YihY/virulence factor BrkB family protein [Salibacteraceae bacterium]